MRDADNLIWNAQSLTASEYSNTNGNVFDQGLATNDYSNGEPLAAVITVDVAADSTTGDETYAFAVVQSAAASLSSPDELVRVSFTAAQAAAGALAAGKQVVVPLPAGSGSKRYLGLYYIGGGTTPTITVTAYLVPAKDAAVQKYPPKAYTVTSA